MLDELRAHPKRWALVTEFKSTSAGPTRIKKLRAEYPAEEWEFRAARTSTTTGALYMRWLGEPT